MMPARRPPLALVATAFLLSGFTSLVLQVIWMKSLALLLGSTLHAVSTVVAVFLAGLALGAFFAGRYAHRLRRPLVGYGILEIGVGLYAFLSLYLLAALDPIVASSYASLGFDSPVYLLVRIALSAVVLLPPTILMGATLPWLVAWATRAGGSFGKSLGRLYGINTMGAVLGALTAGFWLVPSLGLQSSTFVVGALALALGTAITWIGMRESVSEPVAVTHAEDGKKGSAHRNRWLAAVLFGVSGAIALTLEVTWARVFGLIFGSSVYSFSLVLGAYLLGVAAGSVLWGSRLADSKKPWTAFAGLQVSLAAGVVFGIWLLPQMPEIFVGVLIASRQQLSAVFATQIALAGLIAFIPTFALGAIFPVGARLLGGDRESAAESTGLAYTVNTLGTVTGTMLAGFLLLPQFGIHVTLVGCTIGSLVLGLVAWRAQPAVQGTAQSSPAPAKAPGKGKRMVKKSAQAPAFDPLVWGVVGLGAVVLLAAIFAPQWNKSLFTMGAFRTASAGPEGAAPDAARAEVQRRLADEVLLYYKEGLHAVISVHTMRSIPGSLTLRINGKPDASTLGDMVTQIMLGHMPMLWAKPDAEVAIIGHGSGVTAGAALASDPGRIVVIEIEPEVLEASRYFDSVNEFVLDDPRVETIIEDGRQHLLHSGETYDVIISQPSNPWIAGINNLFTVDFYERAKLAIRPGGVFTCWVQLYQLSPESLASLLSAIQTVFPEAEAFRFDHDLVIVAPTPGTKATSEGILVDSQPGPATQYLTRFTLHADGYVAAHHLGTVAHLLTLLPEVPLNTDDLPYVEYRAPYDMFRSVVGALGTDPERAREADSFAALERWVDSESLNGVAFAAARVAIRSGQMERARSLRNGLAARNGADAPGVLFLDEEIVHGEENLRVEEAVRRAEAGLAADDLPMVDANLTQALQTAPRHPVAHLLAARVAMRRDDLEVAKTHLNQAMYLGDHSQNFDANLNLGIIAMREGNLDLGRAHFETAREVQPGEPIGYVNLARWYVQTGRVDSAQVILELGKVKAFPLYPLEEAIGALSQGRSF